MTLLPQQSLIRGTPIQQTVGRQTGFWSSVIFDALIVLSAIGASLFYRRYLDGEVGYLALLISAGVFLTFTLLGTLFTREFTRRLFIIILESLGLIAFFNDYPLKILGIVSGITFVFFLWGEILGRQELDNSLDIKFFKLARITFSKVVTGIVFFLVILYIPHLEINQVIVPKTIFQNFWDGTAKFANNLYPEINFRSSIDNLAKSIVTLDLRNASSFQSLSPPRQAEAINGAAAKLIESFGKTFGVSIKGPELISEVLYNFADRGLREWRDRLGNWFQVAFIIGFFLILRSIAVIFYWLIAVFGWFIYELLLAFNFVHITGESRSKEVVEYS